jgi:hypothetical protein
LGALLDVAVQGLQQLPGTTLETLPRLADFALWATACEDALGWQRGAFMAAYQDAQDDLIKDALEAEPVAVAMLKLPAHGDGLTSEWTLTASELLDLLNEVEGHKDKRPPKGWPGAAHILSGTLKRIAPALSEQGLEVTQVRESDAKRSKKWLVRINRENKRPKRPGPSDETRNDVTDAGSRPDASPDASQVADASSVQGGGQASGDKHRAARKPDASDASKPYVSGTPVSERTSEEF